MSSDNVADTDIIGWFKRRSLPITDGMMVKLTDFGVSLVEDLKLLENEFIEDLFKEAKPIEKIKANVAFKELKADKFSWLANFLILPAIMKGLVGLICCSRSNAMTSKIPRVFMHRSIQRRLIQTTPSKSTLIGARLNSNCLH